MSSSRNHALMGLLIMVFLPLSVWAWPWSQDMMNQPSIKPQEGEMKPFPSRSIPVKGTPMTSIKVKSVTDAITLTNPIKATKESIHKGRQLFQTYCAACHGLDGKAQSPVAMKMKTANVIVRDLTEGYVQNDLTEGWVWGTITFGSISGLMPAYGNPNMHPEKRGSNDLSPTERWHVVNYVKHGLTKEKSGATMAQKKPDQPPASH